MKKIIMLCSFLIVVTFVWQGINFFKTVNEPLTEKINVAQSFVKENTTMEAIDAVDFYHGNEAFYIFKGINNEKDDIIIWVPESFDTYIKKHQDEGLSFQDVVDFTNSELNPKEIISIKLGMENLIPLYEIIYKDQQGRYSYYYISFKDGSYLKHYHLKV